MIFRIFLIIVFIHLLNIYDGNATKDNRRLQMHKVICTKHNNVLRIFECDVQAATEPNIYLFSGRMISTKTFDNEFLVRLRLHVNRANVHRELRIIDLNVDFCKPFNIMMWQSIAFGPITREIKRTSNFPKECPIKEEILYTVDNFTGTPDMFGKYSQDLNFTLTIDFYDGRIPYATQTNIGSFWGS